MEKQRKENVVLIGGGIMSATLGTLLKELVPEWEITVFEKLSNVGEESSNEWNNAGTGHAALCELNYTDVRPDGSIDISKAVKVNEQFQVSKQFWSFLVNKKLLNEPRKFIMELPHVSLVKGEGNVEFLRKRYEALSGQPLFKGMEFTDDPRKLMQWLPLIMNERIIDEPMAATKIDTGTDVNFGALTRMLFDHLQNKEVQIKYKHQVDNINRLSNGSWELKVQNLEQGTVESHEADFVFIGAGGGSLHLLQKSGIPEGRRIGGFPVSGLFLICNNEDVIERHHAKVYGKAPVGAPPMSVPHLDSRYIDGKKTLLFGPFAGFTPKFLKNGSLFDLTSSIKKDNISTMVGAGVKNFSLTKYLIRQLLLSKEKRMDELRQFIPTAKSKDWDLLVAGQRVQVIAEKGTLKFGTEVICAKDGSIAALLGASPGASTAVSAMLDLLERCFSDYIDEWEPKIREMIPSFRESLSENPELLGEIDSKTSDALGLVKMDARL